jgi:tetratricopeptide (TPR) repeat protein
VTAQLIDPTTGINLWVERYDRYIVDIFEVQDEITAMIVNTLAGEITRDRHKRSMAKSSDAVNAYDHFLRASEMNWRVAPENIRNARVEALKAIAIDKGFARAYALIAWTYISDAMNAWAKRPADALKDARKYALAAVDADGLEPFGHAVLGWVYMWSGDFDRGLAEQLRAIADNPGSAHYRSLYAFTLAYAGQSEKAIEELEKAMLLNPRYPDLYHVHYGRALFNLRQYDEAIQHLERIRTSQPGHANAIALAAACYAALGRMEDANATIDEVRKASPNYTLKHARQFIPFAVEQELEHFIENLALAGLDS